jgi:hypothetical protein
MDLTENHVSVVNEDVSDSELIRLCNVEIKNIEKKIIEIHSDLIDKEIHLRIFLSSDNRKREFINLAYRWRTAVSILKDFGVKAHISSSLVDVWLFGLKHMFWKANHFCWNLNQYGESEHIKKSLRLLFNLHTSFEWVKYQILSNMAIAQKFTEGELLDISKAADTESSVLVRLGYYKLLLIHLKDDSQLFAKVAGMVANEKEVYLKHVLLLIEQVTKPKMISELTKNWLGL